MRLVLLPSSSEISPPIPGFRRLSRRVVPALRLVLIGLAPGVVWHRFFQIRPILTRLLSGFGVHRSQALFCAGIMARVDAVLVEGLFQRDDLGLGRLYFRLADLGKILGCHIACQQADARIG